MMRAMKMSPAFRAACSDLHEHDQQVRSDMARKGLIAPAPNQPLDWALIINADLAGMTPRLGLLYRERTTAYQQAVRRDCVRLYCDSITANVVVLGMAGHLPAMFNSVVDMALQASSGLLASVSIPEWTIRLMEAGGVLAMATLAGLGQPNFGEVLTPPQPITYIGALIALATLAVGLYHSEVLGTFLVSVPAAKG